MFTGIITEVGVIDNINKSGGGTVLKIRASQSAKELKINDSVSINGACQTVVRKSNDSFEVVAVEETLKKTTLGSLRKGEKINLELAMRLNDRLGGHLVLGHVDCVGKITKIKKLSSSWLVSVKVPTSFRKYIIPVGSITIDGVSLTVADQQKDSFVVSIIPHTFENTIFKNKSVNDSVNLEFDLIGKYVESLIGYKNILDAHSFTENKLSDLGY
jgi:riboflavin synthase